jgi:hypothetical protein
MPKICYNCGIALTADNSTVEHVPAKNLYEGFDIEFKVNRITVPACVICNNLYSKIDQEIRDALAVKNDDPQQRKDLTNKGVRSILRRANWTDRTHFNSNGQVIAVNFSYSDLRKIHIKNFKALFFRKYGFPVPGNFEIDIIADGDDSRIETAQLIHDYLCVDREFEFSGHPAIFKFIVKDMTPDKEMDTVYESGDFYKLIIVAALLIYHDNMGAVVVAGKKDYIENCKIKKSMRG